MVRPVRPRVWAVRGSALHVASWSWLYAIAAVAAVAAVAVQPCGGQNHQIHRRMSVDDLRQLFQVESHDDVPEYEVVRVTSRIPTRGDLAGGGGGGTSPSTSTTTTTTSTEAPSDGAAGRGEGEEAGVARVVELSAFGRQHRLRLQPALGLLNKDLKVFVADQANGTDVDYTELHHDGEHIGEIFQDEDNEAALLLHRDPDGSYLLEGTIGHDLVVKPVPASVRQHLDDGGGRGKHQDPDDEMFLDDEDAAEDEVVRGFPLGKDSNEGVRFEDGPSLPTGRRRLRRSTQHHAHIVYKRASAEAAHGTDLSDYAYMEPDAIPVRGSPRGSPRSSRLRRSIVKREAPYVIYPEILVIVDYDGYRLHGGDNVQIKRYFVSFWNGVDLRYKLLKGPRIRISIAGIIISRGRDATPYLERNRVGRDAIDSAAALTDMGKYLFRERRLPVYDIAVAVTKLDMCRRQYPNDACNRGTAGFAYVGGACVVNKRLEKVNSVAIIEDTGGFSGIIVAAHEVGHLLGAVHDGSPPPSYLGGPGAEKCRWEDGYIMSDLRHTEKGFKWSPCTVSSFHHFLNGDTATCLYNSPHEDESLPRVLPGKLLTLDAQCRKDRGTSACFKDDRVCAQLFCFDSGSGYCVAYRPAAEGSPCGDGQYCMNGKCVVEHENIIPDYSQNAPAFLRRIDDDGATQPRPYYTYNITTQRSDWAEFWNDRLNDITTTPTPDTTKSYITYSYSTSYDTTQNQNAQNYHLANSLGNNNINFQEDSLQRDDKTSQAWPAKEQQDNQVHYDAHQDIQNGTGGGPNHQSNHMTQRPTTSSNYFHTFSTTKSPYDFSDFGKSTKPHTEISNIQTQSSSSYYDSSSSQPNSYDEYYKTSTTKQNYYDEYYRTSTPRSNLYDEYYKTSTTKQNLYDYYSTTASQNLYDQYYKTSSTEAPNIYAEYYKTSTENPNSYEKYYQTSTPQTPPQTSTKNPYDFSDFGHQKQNYENTASNYHTSTTHNTNEYYQAQSTENPYAAYELYYKTSTTQRPYYQSSGTSTYESHALVGNQSPDSSKPASSISHPQSPSAPLYLDSSTKLAAGTDDCVDVARSISGGLTCREFLERYGFQYCNYQSMRKSCCASQREICTNFR